MGREIRIVPGSQSCALGAAMAGAVAAGLYDGFAQAVENMAGRIEKSYSPDAAGTRTYDRLFRLYGRLHDVYGRKDCSDGLHDVMKELLDISETVKKDRQPDDAG